jgi:hypothetical protein
MTALNPPLLSPALGEYPMITGEELHFNLLIYENYEEVLSKVLSGTLSEEKFSRLHANLKIIENLPLEPQGHRKTKCPCIQLYTATDTLTKYVFRLSSVTGLRS